MAVVEKPRPLIRVEIQNNFTESMDVDEDKSEEEEGEINDDDDTQTTTDAPAKKAIFNRAWSDTGPKDTFTIGINIFDKEEQEKRLERAKRFRLKPDEIRNFSDEDLKLLHESLGITEENQSDVRFEAIHMLYTDNMNTEDILDYFSKYAPTSIEWIDNKSCNVIWVETVSAARALHSVSKVIRGMPVRAPCDPFAKDFLDTEAEKEPEEEEDGGDRSILLRNKEREVELVAEPKPREVELQEDEDDDNDRARFNTSNSVDVSDITAPIPPGYWRLGEGHPKSKCILLRFAFKTDKQAYKVESFNKYYKKLGNAKIQPMDPRMSKHRSIFERNRDLHNTSDKNPWGVLAQNWDEDAKFRERDRVDRNRIELSKISNPSIRRRLGTKRQRESESDSDVEIVESEKQGKKKFKLPRMRMYADEEEEKIKRKKLLQTLKLQAEKISRQTVDNSDLRSILAITNRQTVIEDPNQQDHHPDLGFSLNNRSRRMIFTVQRALDEKTPKKHHSTHSHESTTIKMPSPRRHRSESERTHHYGSMHADREESLERERRKKLHEHSRSRHSRSDRDRKHRSWLRSERTGHEKRSRDEYYSEEEYTGKPRSKVAVVIKTQKAPAVASKVWSRIGQRKSASEESESQSEESESESEESESESESSESSESSSESTSESEEESSSEDDGERPLRKRIERPGFSKNGPEKVTIKTERRSPLKIEISNDHFKRV